MLLLLEENFAGKDGRCSSHMYRASILMFYRAVLKFVEVFETDKCVSC